MNFHKIINNKFNWNKIQEYLKEQDQNLIKVNLKKIIKFQISDNKKEKKIFKNLQLKLILKNRKKMYMKMNKI